MREPPPEQLLQELLYVNTPETIYNPDQWASDLTGLWPTIYLDFGKDAATATNFRACITQPRKWETLWESLGWPTPAITWMAYTRHQTCRPRPSDYPTWPAPPHPRTLPGPSPVPCLLNNPQP
jgi:hypothetical protein